MSVLTSMILATLINTTAPALMPQSSATPQYKSWKQWPTQVARPSGLKEPNLTQVKQITFGGQNAEAYWDKSGKRLVYQSKQPEFADEQIFIMNADGSDRRLVSTGLGRCSCSYFSPDGQSIYFSSTHDKNTGAQEPVDMSKGYVWMINPQFGLWRVKVDGSNLEKVIDMPGYVAETTIAPNGGFMTFTGSWNNNIQIYRSDLNGFNIKSLATEYGYNGGPFVSWDSNKIVYRRSAPFATSDERKAFGDLLADHLVRPSQMDIWIMDSDGSNKKQVTDLPGASFAPFIHPNGKQIIFSTNHHDASGREFDLFVINIDGTGLRQITFTPEFDGFPMFTRDGKRLVWASNRFGSRPHETNIFTAQWRD